MTRPILFAALAGLALAGCTEFSTMYKEGTTQTQANSDQAHCNRDAIQAVPPFIVTDWIPYYDGQGRVVGHRVETYDVNEGRRYSFARQCMESKGYQRVTIPFCKPEQVEGRRFQPLAKSPPLGPTICAIRQEGGGRTLVDLSKPL